MHNSSFLVSSGNEAASSTLSSKTKTIAEIRASVLVTARVLGVLCSSSDSASFPEVIHERDWYYPSFLGPHTARSRIKAPSAESGRRLVALKAEEVKKVKEVLLLKSSSSPSSSSTATTTTTYGLGGSVLYCEKERMREDQFEQLKMLVDIGDILGACGSIKRTEKLWYDLKSDRNGLVLEGRHNADSQWISDLRKKGNALIIPRVVLETIPMELLGKKNWNRAIDLIVTECKEMEYDGIVLDSWSRWAAYGVLHDPEMRSMETLGADPDYTGLKLDDEAVYYKVADECPKGRVYSLRSLGRKKRRYVDPDASTSQVS
ncbi:hypothetical protein Scep_023515 [Stephania cephalantha]|uniref:Uncharacterized protein n=1 Tax=Stephania cephalantha TaxID=152367 RepID=A0AAP0EXK1_9MAGN